MATARPVISVYQFDNPSQKSGTVNLPTVMAMPLRPDLVADVHKNMSKNRRQPYANKPKVGYDTAAESWGTGRAVSRIPRVPGGGTHRAGQGAFGNMCRGGGRAHPTQIWRRWHRKINFKKRRAAVVSCISGSALPPLVMAKGHRIDQVAEVPLVVSDGIESLTKTKQAVEILKKLGCGQELQRVIDSKKLRAGKGKAKRRHTIRKGPLIIYNEDKGIAKAMRNIPGVETNKVTKLNLMKLAPGGIIGRFCILTEGAMIKLQEIYGKRTDARCPLKQKFTLPRPLMENADVKRIIDSVEVQTALRPKLEAPKSAGKKRNPLANDKLMEKLNPGFIEKKKKRAASATKGTPEFEVVQAAKKARLALRKEHKKTSKGENSFFNRLMKAYEPKAKAEEAEGGDED